MFSVSSVKLGYLSVELSQCLFSQFIIYARNELGKSLMLLTETSIEILGHLFCVDGECVVPPRSHQNRDRL